MKLLTAVLALSLGCGDVLPGTHLDAQPPDLDEGLRSGTRLKLRWEAYDGARVASTLLFDSQRDEPCFPRAWADGRTYCTPRTSVVVHGNATCTQALALVPTGTCASSTEYVHESDPATCDTLPTKIYPRGAPTALTQFWTKDATGCSGPFDVSAAALHVVGAEVPLSGFVEMTPSAVDRSARITQRFHEGSDGTRVFLGHHDAELDVDCNLQVDADPSTGRCIPSSLGVVTRFADSACEERRMEARSGCAVPRLALELSPSCFMASAGTFYRPGALAARSPLFERTGATCAASTARDDRNYYAVGATVTLPGLPRAFDTTPGRRIQLMHYDNGPGQLRDTRLYDALKQVECTGATFGDVTRCLPVDRFGISTGYFSDPGCQTAVAVVDVEEVPACVAPQAPRFARRTIAPLPGTCGTGVEVRTVGAAYTAPLYVRAGVDCVAAEAANRTRYLVGDAVPLTEFVTATSSTDP